MSISKIVYESDVLFELNESHRGGVLINSTHGAVNGFTMGISFYTETEFGKPGIHEDQEAFFILEGEGAVQLGDQEFKILPGASFIAPAGVPHSIKRNADCKYVKLIWCHGAV